MKHHACDELHGLLLYCYVCYSHILSVLGTGTVAGKANSINSIAGIYSTIMIKNEILVFLWHFSTID